MDEMSYNKALQDRDRVSQALRREGVRDAGVGLADTDSGVVVKVHLNNPLPESVRSNIANSLGINVMFEETGMATAY